MTAHKGIIFQKQKKNTSARNNFNISFMKNEIGSEVEWNACVEEMEFSLSGTKVGSSSQTDSNSIHIDNLISIDFARCLF